jgi:hypothetical protein
MLGGPTHLRSPVSLIQAISPNPVMAAPMPITYTPPKPKRGGLRFLKPAAGKLMGFVKPPGGGMSCKCILEGGVAIFPRMRARTSGRTRGPTCPLSGDGYAVFLLTPRGHCFSLLVSCIRCVPWPAQLRSRAQPIHPFHAARRAPPPPAPSFLQRETRTTIPPAAHPAPPPRPSAAT